MRQNTLIPEKGMVSLTYLAEMTGVNVYTLTQSLTDYGVSFIKFGGTRGTWYVNLEDVAEIPHMAKGGK